MVARIKDYFHELGLFTAFSLKALRFVPKSLAKPGEILKNIYSIGVLSVPVVALTGLFSGMILGLSLGDALESIIVGTSQFISGALSVGYLKELGPVLTSLIVVSRVCSSVTAQIGTMRVTEQIDALKTFSVDPIAYLVTPRVIAGIISLPILGLISIVISLFGGWLMVWGVHGIQTNLYIEWAQIPLKIKFVFESLFKMSIIGAFILLISTYHGFYAKGGAAGVGEATIKSVVTSSFVVILLDYILGTLFIMLGGLIS